MKIAGLFLLITGWLLAVAAMCLLKAAPVQILFTVISIAIQLVGFAFVVRVHMGTRKEHP